MIIDKIIGAARGKIGEKKVRSLLKELVADGKVTVTEVKRHKARPEQKYARADGNGSCQGAEITIT